MASHGTASLVMIAFLLVTVTLVDAAPPVTSLLTCNKAYGVKENDTCFAVAEATGLTLEQFLSFNPNINCRRLFIGQWVCVEAVS
jgi:hypothetical protein